MEFGIDIKVLDNKQQVSSQKIKLGLSDSFIIGSGCFISYLHNDNEEYLENGKYRLEIRKGNKLYDLLEKSADKKEGNYLLFDIDKLKIDGKQNLEITLNSSSNKNFTKIKFDSNIVSIQKTYDKSFSTLVEYDKPTDIELPIYFSTLLSSEHKHTEIKNLPSQFFNLIDSMKEDELFAKESFTQITTSKINIGKKTLKLAKIYNTQNNMAKYYVVNGTKLMDFSPENVNIFSKDDKFLLAISLPGPKGIGNAKSTKAIAIDGLSKENIDEAWKLIGGNEQINIQDSSKLGQLVNIKALSKEKEFTKKATQKTDLNLQNEKGNSMIDQNPTEQEYEDSLKDININPNQPETSSISPDEVLKFTPPADELSQEELDKELGNPLAEEIENPNYEGSHTTNPSNDSTPEDNSLNQDQKIEETEILEEEKNPNAEENANDSNAKPSKEKESADEEKTFDFSIIAKLISLSFILMFVFTLVSGGTTLPLILAFAALASTGLTYTFEGKLSKVKIKSKSKEKKQAAKEKRKAKKLEKQKTKQAKKEQKQEENKNKQKKQTEKTKTRKNKQQEKTPEENEVPKQEEKDESKSESQEDKKAQDKEKSINLYQTKQAKLKKVISTMENKIDNCNDKISICEKEHATLLEQEDIAKSNQKISNLKKEKSFLEVQKENVKSKDKEMQNLLSSLKESKSEEQDNSTLAQLSEVTGEINSHIENFKKGETAFTKILNGKAKQNLTQNEQEQNK